MTFEQTTDYGLVRQVMTDPRIYRWIVDDFSPSCEDFEPCQNPLMVYVAVRDGSALLGLFVFAPHSATCWEVHTCLLPNAWGERARTAGREMAAWFWQQQATCARIVTSVPAYNRLALRFARDVGMKQYGRNEKSFLRHGKLHDQILLGMSRQDG